MYTAGLWHPSYGISTSWVMGVKKGKRLSLSVPDGLVCVGSEQWASEWASGRAGEWVNTRRPPWQPLCWQQKSNGTGPPEMIGPPRLSFHQELAIRATLQSSFSDNVAGRQLDKIRGITEEQAVFLHIASRSLPARETFTSVYGSERLEHLQKSLMMSEMFVDVKEI